MLFEVGIFIVGLVLGACLVAMYFDRRDLGRRVTALEQENEKLKNANKHHLPYRTANEIENAEAALILAMHEVRFNNDLLENAMNHLHMARDNGRSKS